MSIIPNLPPPLNDLIVENEAGTYKDFHLSPDDTYPLAGVTYPTDYGCLPGYIGEDTHDLDFFIGSDANAGAGYIVVWRNDVTSARRYNEHKYYAGMTEEETEQTLEVFKPVLVEHVALKSLTDLIKSIEKFKA